MNMPVQHILIVDDDPNMHRMLGLYLRNEPFEVDFASNGRIGLHKVSQNSYNLIISDLQMPEVDGITFIRQLKEKKASVPVIVISAFGYDQLINDAREAGACQVLQKPFDSKHLMRIIRRALDSN